MAGDTFVYISFWPGFVTGGCDNTAICHYFHAPIRNIKYATNHIGNSAVYYVPS